MFWNGVAGTRDNLAIKAPNWQTIFREGVPDCSTPFPRICILPGRVHTGSESPEIMSG